MGALDYDHLLRRDSAESYLSDRLDHDRDFVEARSSKDTIRVDRGFSPGREVSNEHPNEAARWRLTFQNVQKRTVQMRAKLSGRWCRNGGDLRLLVGRLDNRGCLGRLDGGFRELPGRQTDER